MNRDPSIGSTCNGRAASNPRASWARSRFQYHPEVYSLKVRLRDGPWQRIDAGNCYELAQLFATWEC